MKTLIERFANMVADVLDTLNTYNPEPRIDPLILFIGSLFLTITTSFSRDNILPLLSLIYSLALILALRINYRDVLRIESLVAILALIPSTPLLFSRNGYIGGLDDLSITVSSAGLAGFTQLFLRITLSPLPLVTATTYLGWPMITMVLRRIPIINGIVRLSTIVLVVMPRIIRYTLKLLMAREARLFTYRISSTWTTLATVVGDLLIRSNCYACSLGLAMEARTIGFWRETIYRPSMDKATIAYILLLLSLITIYALVHMGYGPT